MSWLKGQFRKTAERSRYSLCAASELLAGCQDVNSSSLGFALSKIEKFVPIHTQGESAIKESLSRLDNLLAVAPHGKESVARLRSLSNDMVRQCKLLWVATASNKWTGNASLITDQKASMDKFELALTEFTSDQQGILQDSRTKYDIAENLFWALVACLGTVAICLLMEIQRTKLEQVNERKALKLIEEERKRFFDLADSIPIILSASRGDGRAYFFNKAFYSYTGIKASDLENTQWLQIVHPEDIEAAAARHMQARVTPSPFRMGIRLRRADGAYRWIECMRIPRWNADGVLTDWYGSAIDIHDRKEQAAELERLVETRTAALRVAKETAEQALEVKTRFLSTVSHEVRTPMSAIIGLVEHINMITNDEEVSALSGLALDSSKRLLQILNDLLDASKLQAGALQLERRSFAVRPVLADLLQLVRTEADKKQVQVKTHVYHDVPETVIGDELRLRQILQNLAFNAVKFTDKGKVDIRVSVVGTSIGASTLRFTVTDTGIGMTQEQQRRLFKAFSKAEDSISRRYGGTGLGLNICRNLVQLMGGEIGVQSELNVGTTFWVHIPFQEDACLIA